MTTKEELVSQMIESGWSKEQAELLADTYLINEKAIDNGNEKAIDNGNST